MSSPPLSSLPIQIFHSGWEQTYNSPIGSEYSNEPQSSGYLGGSEFGSASSFISDLNASNSSEQNSFTSDPETPLSSLIDFRCVHQEPIGNNVSKLTPSIIDEFKIFIESDMDSETSTWEAFFYNECLILADAKILSNFLSLYYNLWTDHFNFFIVEGCVKQENTLDPNEEVYHIPKKLMDLRYILGVFFKEQLYLISEKNLHDNHLLRLQYDSFIHDPRLSQLFSQDIFSLMADERIKCRYQFIFIWEFFLRHLMTFEEFIKSPNLPIHSFARSDRVRLELPYDTDLQQLVLDRLKNMIVKLNSNPASAESSTSEH